MCRYTPCVISWCSRLRLVWIRCVNDGPSRDLRRLAQVRRAPRTRASAILIARVHSARFSSGAARLERILQHRERHGDAVRRAEQSRCPWRAWLGCTRARWRTRRRGTRTATPRTARASHGTRSIGSVARELLEPPPAPPERPVAMFATRARGRSARSVDPADALANARRRPGASDTVKLPATSCRREHRHVTNRLRERENQQTPPPATVPFCASRYLSCTALSASAKSRSTACCQNSSLSTHAAPPPRPPRLGGFFSSVAETASRRNSACCVVRSPRGHRNASTSHGGRPRASRARSDGHVPKRCLRRDLGRGAGELDVGGRPPPPPRRGGECAEAGSASHRRAGVGDAGEAGPPDGSPPQPPRRPNRPTALLLACARCSAPATPDLPGPGGHVVDVGRRPRSSTGSRRRALAGSWICGPPPRRRSTPTRWSRPTRRVDDGVVVHRAADHAAAADRAAAAEQ